MPGVNSVAKMAAVDSLLWVTYQTHSPWRNFFYRDSCVISFRETCQTCQIHTLLVDICENRGTILLVVGVSMMAHAVIWSYVILRLIILMARKWSSPDWQLWPAHAHAWLWGGGNTIQIESWPEVKFVHDRNLYEYGSLSSFKTYKRYVYIVVFGYPLPKSIVWCIHTKTILQRAGSLEILAVLQVPKAKTHRQSVIVLTKKQECHSVVCVSPKRTGNRLMTVLSLNWETQYPGRPFSYRNSAQTLFT